MPDDKDAVTESSVVDGWSGAKVKADNPYPLLRDATASIRLTAQHYLWTEAQGFHIHPDIPTDAADLKVADVATGNGIWLSDIARRYPSSWELHGFDVSLDQLGPDSWLPANMSMHQWYIFQDPPAEFVGYFDIVQVRLLTVVVKNNDPRAILASLGKLLKSGGYLQWVDLDAPNYSIVTVPGASGEAIQTMVKTLAGTDTWTIELANTMNANGYAGAKQFKYYFEPATYRLWVDNLVCGWKELASHMRLAPEYINEMELKALTEVRQGAAVKVGLLVWVGKKI